MAKKKDEQPDDLAPAVDPIPFAPVTWRGPIGYSITLPNGGPTVRFNQAGFLLADTPEVHAGLAAYQAQAVGGVPYTYVAIAPVMEN
jgi:hypothetical protein